MPREYTDGVAKSNLEQTNIKPRTHLSPLQIWNAKCTEQRKDVRGDNNSAAYPPPPPSSPTKLHNACPMLGIFALHLLTTRTHYTINTRTCLLGPTYLRLCALLCEKCCTLYGFCSDVLLPPVVCKPCPTDRLYTAFHS